MNIDIPESFQSGIAYIEGLNLSAMAEWLREELHEKIHVLAGQAYDYPVQAIVNHYPYLSPETQRRISNAVEVLILNWKKEFGGWTDSAVQALLSLAAELPVAGAKSKLQSLIESKSFQGLSRPLCSAVFGAVAALSKSDDRSFWNAVPDRYPHFTGMTFQVLSRIAPEDAITLLARLPQDESVIGSVARKLPDFISQHEPEWRGVKLSQIGQALDLLPATSAAPLKLALVESGFTLPEIPIQRSNTEAAIFRDITIALDSLPEETSKPMKVIRFRIGVATTAEKNLKMKVSDTSSRFKKTLKTKSSLGQVYGGRR